MLVNHAQNAFSAMQLSSKYSHKAHHLHKYYRACECVYGKEILWLKLAGI